jgi:hypothetical protein
VRNPLPGPAARGPVRRILSTVDPDGTARIAEDRPSPHLHTLPGMPEDLGLTDLWYTDVHGTLEDRAVRPLAVEPEA